MSRFILLLLMPLALLLSQCTSPGVDNRLSRLEAKQDSILKVLNGMHEKNEFMAMRMGWRPPADTLPKDIPQGTSFYEGPDKAKITIVEYSDLQCPYCAQTAPILDSVARTYPNDVKLVFKNFPLSFHPQSRPAAAAAIAAGKQGKFFEFRFRVAPHFRELNDSIYLAVAKDLHLDMARFKKEMVMSPEVNGILEQDIELGRKLGVEGTPTIFVNGKLATDRSFDYFAHLVVAAK